MPMAPHSSTLAWKIPWMEEPGRLQSMGSLSQTRLRDFTFTFCFHALQKEMATHSSVLAWRIPGTGAWWAAVYGVTQSWTWLKWLSNDVLCNWVETDFSLGFPGGSDGKESACMSETWEKEMAIHSNICVWRISMDRGAWQATVDGVANGQIWLSN